MELLLLLLLLHSGLHIGWHFHWALSAWCLCLPNWAKSVKPLTKVYTIVDIAEMRVYVCVYAVYDGCGKERFWLLRIMIYIKTGTNLDLSANLFVFFFFIVRYLVKAQLYLINYVCKHGGALVICGLVCVCVFVVCHFRWEWKNIVIISKW